MSFTLGWSYPRYVFFREEPLDAPDAGCGPRGAQGVALTPGRSIAVDKGSIRHARVAGLQRAADAARADYFTGWGAEVGELAGRLKQGLRLWALWPR